MSEDLVRESKVIAGEIAEATKTMQLALGTDNEPEVVEAKNTFAGAMRDYKSFMDSLSEDDREKIRPILKEHVERMAELAKQLPE